MSHHQRYGYKIYKNCSSSIDVKSTNTTTFNFVSPLQNGNFNITVLYGTQNTTSYLLSDYTEIKVDDKNNLYAIQRSNESVGEIIRGHSIIANKLKMYIFVQSLLNNETIAIGHGKHDVMQNNPDHKSHLVGNGGENIYVVTSGYESLDNSKLPIPEITIYDLDRENLIDTLDLRQINQQIVNDLRGEAKAEAKIEGKNLLLFVYYDQVEKISEILSRTIRYDVVCIRLKNALVTGWHKKLHVLLDDVPMKVEEVKWLDTFYLKSLPLVFSKDKKIIVITARDVGEETEVIIPKKAGQYIFARTKNDLIITNAFDHNLTDNEFCTVSLSNFYQEPKLQTLAIKFADKEILLKNAMNRISSANTLKALLNQHKDVTYNSVFNSLVTNVSSTASHSRKRRYDSEAEGYENEFFYGQNYANSSLEKEYLTSEANRPFSWISGLASWVKGKLFNEQGLFYAQNYANSSMKDIRAIPIIQEHTENKSSGPEISSTTLNSTVILADLITRQLTGVKYGSSVEPLTKDRILESRREVIAESLEMALYKFDQPETYFKNVSMERVGTRIGKGN